MKSAVTLLIASTLVGCAGSQGTEPHDMSAVAHDQAAGSEEQEGSTHAAQYDPEAQRNIEPCAKPICWTSDANPTVQHKKDMEEHRALAESIARLPRRFAPPRRKLVLASRKKIVT